MSSRPQEGLNIMLVTAHYFPATLEDRLAALASTRTGLLAEIETWNQQADFVQAEPGRWCVAEIIYHLHMAESRIFKGLHRLLTPGQRQARASDETLRSEWERLRALVGSRGAPQSAPSSVVPVNAPGFAHGIELLKKSRVELLEMVRKFSLDDLASISMSHPLQIIGTLTGAGWLSTIAFHELRHTEQIRELRPSPAL
jgi:hypothetical protein